jgi:SAM-dependent methyltransferase
MQAFKAITAAILLMLWTAVSAAPQESTSERAIKALEDFFKFDVPYVPTPPEVVKTILKFAGAGPDDTVYDLGSGDGRIVIAAVRDFGVKKGVGIEIDQTLVNKAAANAAAADVSERAQFKNADIYEEDFSDATIITMYLADDANKILRPRLEAQLAPGSRIVSHLFRMGDWKPEKTVRVGDRFIYLWTVR